jgi:hypothetical protein
MKAIANSLYDAIEKLCDAAKDLVSCLDGNVPLSSTVMHTSSQH